MKRATTPTHKFEIPFATSEIDKLILIYAQKYEIILKKEKEDVVFDEDNNKLIVVTLTQEETKLFKEDAVTIQLRIKTNSGKVIAFDEIQINVKDVLDDEVM